MTLRLSAQREWQNAPVVNQRSDSRPVRQRRKDERRFKRLSGLQSYSPALGNASSSPKDRGRAWGRFTVTQFKFAASLVEQIGAPFFIDHPSPGAHRVDGQIKIRRFGGGVGDQSNARRGRVALDRLDGQFRVICVCAPARRPTRSRLREEFIDHPFRRRRIGTRTGGETERQKDGERERPRDALHLSLPLSRHHHHHHHHHLRPLQRFSLASRVAYLTGYRIEKFRSARRISHASGSERPPLAERSPPEAWLIRRMSGVNQ